MVKKKPLTRIKALVGALALSGAAFSYAHADWVGPDWMPAEKVMEKLRASGYTAIHELKADDGRWEGEGMKNAQRMEFSADPRTGNIIWEGPDH
ncbi:PepSY domain-containing protein [Chelatococcus sp. GCM10030263]|uniref:PepSY domain-containing protein n=1 Tax=Chelatococcus sp. GCM10030263 TaxID=3273387 RepID=UPI00361E365D